MREMPRNDLYAYNARDSTMTNCQTIGTAPTPRTGHACALVSNVLIVWGGTENSTDPTSTVKETLDNSLYFLNLGAWFIAFYPVKTCYARVSK